MNVNNRILPVVFLVQALVAGGVLRGKDVPKVGTVAELTQLVALDASAGTAWHLQIRLGNLVPREVTSVTEASLPQMMPDDLQIGARIFMVPMEPGEKIRLGLRFFAPEKSVKFVPLLGKAGPLTTEIIRAVRGRIGHRLDITNVTTESVVISYLLHGPINCSYSLAVERMTR